MRCNLKVLLLIIVLLIFNGCISSNAPIPYRYVYSSVKVDDKINIAVDDKSKIKIFIDNRYDIDRKDKVLKSLYHNLSNKKISLMDEPLIVEKNKNIKSIYGTYTKIDTKYSYEPCFSCMFLKKDIFIKQSDLQLEDNAILINRFNDRSLIVSLYASSYINKLRGIRGIPIKFKLDTEKLNKGEAYFTDEYLLQYSLKESLKKEFALQGYSIVKSKHDADIVIVVENLGFDEIKDLIKNINYPKSDNISYEDLSNPLNTNKYYKEPSILLDFYSTPWTLSEELKKYTKIKTIGNYPTGDVGKAVAVASLINTVHKDHSPISTVNFVTVFNKTKKIGKVIGISIMKDDERTIEAYYRTLKYNIVLSDELIDELNQQAAKQILNKIRFVETK